MAMNTVVRPRRPAVTMAAFLALALAAWGCSGKTKGFGGGGSGGSGGHGGSGSSAETGSGGECSASGAPEPPVVPCDASKDVYKECPLPPSVTTHEYDGTTVYYYSDPSCRGGFCHYCSTSTFTEDPNATGAP